MHHHRSGPAALLAGLLALVMLPLLAGPAHALTTGKFTGNVKAGTANLAGVSVQLYRPQSSYWQVVATTTTNASGNYSFANLTQGDYRLCFVKTGYVTKCHANASYASDATTVALSDATPARTVNIALAVQPSISGAVTAGGVAQRDVEVSAYTYDPATGDLSRVDRDTTEADGTYSLRVPVGSYRIEFGDEAGDLATEYYPDHTTGEDAADVPVTAANPWVTGINTEMSTGTAASGQVLVAGAAAQFADVYVAPVTAAGVVSDRTVAWTRTNRRGEFTLRHLRPGSYVFAADYDTGTDYLNGFWGDTQTPLGARRAVIYPGLPLGGITIDLAGPDPAWTQPVPPPPPGPAPAPKLSVVTAGKVAGKARVGRTLKLDVGTYSPSSARVKIQWLANGKKIKKATTKKLRLARTLRGKKIAVRLVVSAPGLEPLTVVIKAGKVKAAQKGGKKGGKKR